MEDTDFRSDLGINLADPDPEKADKAILDMTQVWFDDGHSAFISSSYLTENDPQAEFRYSMQGISAVKNTRQATHARYRECFFCVSQSLLDSVTEA